MRLIIIGLFAFLSTTQLFAGFKDGVISYDKKALALDEHGIPKLTIVNVAQFSFIPHCLVDTYYFTPRTLTNPQKLINQHYRIITYWSEFVNSALTVTYMSELREKENNIVDMRFLFAIPDGYKVKYRIIRCDIPRSNTCPLISVLANGKKIVLKKKEKVTNRIVVKTNEITFFADKPQFAFSLKCEDSFSLVEENEKLFLHFSLNKPLVIEVNIAPEHLLKKPK